MKVSTIVLIGFVLLKFALQYIVISPDYELHRDEYLHLDQANHLAAGYFSVPPFTSWIALLIKLLGNTFFWIKFFPALFGALTLIVVWQIVKELNGQLYAKSLAAFAIIFSMITRLNILFQPNSFDVLSWTLVYWCLIRFYKTNNAKQLLWMAFFFAIGMLNKYNLIFLAAGLLPAVLLTNGKNLISNRFTYLALLIILVILTPNIIWQYNNHFPVFHHMHELAATQLVNVKRSDFVIKQFLFFLGSLFIIIAAWIGFLKYPPFKKFRFIFYSYLIILAIYTYFKAKDYYAVGLYPVLIAFGSVYLEYVLSTARFRKLIRPILFVIILGLFLPPFYAVFPILNPEQIKQHSGRFKKYGVLKWEDGKDHQLPQDFADMLGWKELAYKVDSIYNSIPKEQNTIVICENYGEAGAINYYSINKNIHAVSFNADYINWFPLDHEINNIIAVKEDGSTISDSDKKNFGTIIEVSMIENKNAREYGTKIILLKDATSSINTFLLNKISKYKNENQ
ncbi:MAG: glycosyltransferase family 39 protein [Ferruginibacter sp.]